MGIRTGLERGAESSRPLTRSLFDDGWDAARVADFVNEQRNVTIATASPAGQPHAAVVIGGAVDDEIYVTVHEQSVLARNLAADGRIGFSVAGGAHVVMGQGRSVPVGRAADVAELIDALAGASPHGRFTPDGWDGWIHRLDVRRLFAS